MRATNALASALLVLGLGSCRENPFEPAEYNPDWTQESHGQAPPNYSVVFPDDSINRIEIYMTASDWSAIQTQMKALWGFGFGAKDHPCCGPYPTGEIAYTDVRVVFKGKTWNHVGFRPKGNSTLHYAWNLGIYKFPFRLKFDAFEDEFPETWNQRLYGFKDFSASALVYDRSGVRERIASELFRQAGAHAPLATSYRVYIDFGYGLVYNGVYTFNELPEDTMLETQLGENTGNIYKPESSLESFVPTDFPRQNNEGSTDYSDVQALISLVNNWPFAISDPPKWRSELEAVFNVDQYLKVLAVSAVIASWDGYGNIPHNYYLYNHSSRHLTWIPWDQDLSLSENPPAVGASPRTLGLSLAMNEVPSTWPLIRNLLDDPVYAGRYRANVKNLYDNIFTQAKVEALIDKYMNLTQSSFVGADGEIAGHTFISNPSDYVAQRGFLKSLVAHRREAMSEFLRDSLSGSRSGKRP